MNKSIISCSMEAAFRFLKEAPYSRWYKNGVSLHDKDEKFAFQRLERPLFTPGLHPSFLIEKEDRLFAMGSCFARGVEKAMAARGFVVSSMANEFDHFELANNSVTGLGFTNKYSTYSILNEVRWALDSASDFPVQSIVEIEDGRWVDPHTNPTLKFVCREKTLERRKIIQDVVSRIKACRVLFITLGLVEVWYDKEAETYINMAPNPEMRRRYPERYTFHVTTFKQNMANLEQLYDLLTQHGHPDFHVIVTVSPVPLMATFTERDIVLANTYSKSVLRSVAEEWSACHENVDYFPSYEIVMNSDKSICWTEDKRHVRGEIVEHIMNVFTDHYLANPKANRPDMLSRLKGKLKRFKA